MSVEDSTPTLLQLLFKDSAATASQTASERLLKWAQAFDGWLAGARDPATRRSYLLAWRQLVELLGAPPWKVTRADIERYRDWLAGQGYADRTIHNHLRNIRYFYEWCSRGGVDLECGPGFNPAAGTSQPKRNPYGTARTLSESEAGALLEVLKADECSLSQRDYAFLLSRLRLGVKNKLLIELRWGQIELREGRAWVEWAPGLPRTPLPEEAWKAILGYLEGSGRLGSNRPEGMPPQAFIFAPLGDSFGLNIRGRAEDWDEGRCLSLRRLDTTLKTYGRLVGIAADKLNLTTLRYTAVERFLETSPSTDELEDFLVTGRGM
jgi:integrase